MEQMRDEKLGLEQELDTIKCISTRRQADRNTEVTSNIARFHMFW